MYHTNTPGPVPCHKCGAQPGELCRTKSGRSASQWHEGRIHAEWQAKRYAAMSFEERAEERAKRHALREKINRYREASKPEPKSLVQRVVSTITRWVA
jgi:hypothetical protein